MNAGNCPRCGGLMSREYDPGANDSNESCLTCGFVRWDHPGEQEIEDRDVLGRLRPRRGNRNTRSHGLRL